MGLFDKIKHAIFGDKGPLGGQFSGRKDTPAPAPAPAAPRPAAAPAAAAPKPAAAPTAAPAPAPAPVDVEAVLTQKAAARGKPSNWRTSIVDLLQLLDLDSSLEARKELAGELNVHAGAHGSAEQNIALHKAVMKALAQNGGKVPADLAD
ncbi:DUF3597 family protein [Sphingomonas jatrophae]|uniref:DUF3597 domain-containing protein n=1 Tax=Sphingomonas jatrophae TaxID=1166337 RepID=A0A1I6LCX3_9SPHN|nr:DUF3597 family protein [Sphingomonas jatrophae]SFS01342.1 protein of unknown function [Sphingomonas jatrophae]